MFVIFVSIEKSLKRKERTMENPEEIYGYKFIGNPEIVCKCMSNGQKCNQRNMEVISENPFFKTSEDSLSYVCNRMYKRV
jgi:hypothetical protein